MVFHYTWRVPEISFRGIIFLQVMQTLVAHRILKRRYTMCIKTQLIAPKLYGIPSYCIRRIYKTNKYGMVSMIFGQLALLYPLFSVPTAFHWCRSIIDENDICMGPIT